MSKSTSISIRIDEDELEKLKIAAKLESYSSYSEFIRRTALLEAARIIKENNEKMPRHLTKEVWGLKKSINDNNEQYAELAALFKTFADETRLKIMFALAEKELCVQELTVVLNASSSLVSHQMRTLKSMKLVKQRREGKNVFYSLDDEHVLHILKIAVEHNKHD